MSTFSEHNRGRHYIIVEHYKSDETYDIEYDPYEYDFHTVGVWTLEEANERLAKLRQTDGYSYYIINISPECKVE